MSLRKKALIFVIVMVLVVPIKRVHTNLGTIEYTSLLYKYIMWDNTEPESKVNHKNGTEFHFFPSNFHTLEYFMDPVPTLLKVYNSDKTKSVICEVGTYSLEQIIEGKKKNVVSDSTHPIEFEYNEYLDLKSFDKVYLSNEQFSISSINIYEDGIENNLQVNTEYNNTDKTIIIPKLTDGTYIMEINTKNDNGKVMYAFKYIIGGENE